MASRPIVVRDVSLALRKAIMCNSQFDPTTYNVDIVPSAEPMKGWGAKTEAWGLLLEEVAARLCLIDKDYKKFQPTKKIIDATLKKPVKETIGEIAEIILKK